MGALWQAYCRSTWTIWNRQAYNKSLVPEKVHDGQRVLRMGLRRNIPSFIKFGPFLVWVFYPGQPKHCWKCSPPDHIGRECPFHFCFNCERCGHIAMSVSNARCASPRNTLQWIALGTGVAKHVNKEPRAELKNREILLQERKPKTQGQWRLKIMKERK